MSTLTITDVKVTSIEAPWGPWTRRWLLIRIETSEGIIGYGDTWANPETKAAVMGFKDMLIGKDPTNVEALHRSLVPNAYAVFAASHFNSGMAVHAVSGIETALWDIAGKAAGVPVYKLLGGKYRDQIRLYCCVGGLESYLDMKEIYEEMGISLLKFDITPNAVSQIPGTLMDKHLTRKGMNKIVGLMEKIRILISFALSMIVSFFIIKYDLYQKISLIAKLILKLLNSKYKIPFYTKYKNF